MDEPIRLSETKDDPPPPRRNNKAVIAAVLLGAAAVGVGAYAYKTRMAHADTVAELERLESENQSLSDALELHRSGEVELGTKLERCEEDLEIEKTTHANADERRTQIEAELAACEQNVSSADALLEEFQSLTGKFRSMIDTGKLDVVFRRGEMIVNLPEAILFPSGSADLSDRGKRALAEVAAILRKMPNRRFTVAGHTDNVPVSTDEFPSNWELSSARAVAVARALVSEGVRPRNLVAAGYSKYRPIARNRSRRGRRANRRIEIVLEPKLRPMPELEKAVRRAREKRP